MTAVLFDISHTGYSTLLRIRNVILQLYGNDSYANRVENLAYTVFQEYSYKFISCLTDLSGDGGYSDILYNIQAGPDHSTLQRIYFTCMSELNNGNFIWDEEAKSNFYATQREYISQMTHVYKCYCMDMLGGILSLNVSRKQNIMLIRATHQNLLLELN